MIESNSLADYFHSPSQLAEQVLAKLSGDNLAFPINPFQLLTDIGVPFVLRDFDKYEGVYLPAENEKEIAAVGINNRRPIQRQRFTAAHELCHHIKDHNRTLCELKDFQKSAIERFAEDFASELLMPRKQMLELVNKHRQDGYVSFDNALHIAEHFGVSFHSCILRLAYVFRVIDGDTSSAALSKRCSRYKVTEKKRQLGLSSNDTNLLVDLVAAMEKWMPPPGSENIRLAFVNNYVYHDSHLEGVNLPIEEVAQIVTDLRHFGSQSDFCNESNSDIIQVAGHANVLEYLFEFDKSAPVSVYKILELNRRLFQYSPYPDAAGSIRNSNNLVLGAKFEALDCSEVIQAMMELDTFIQETLKVAFGMPFAQYIERIAYIHHRLTVIHPFPDGNGRSIRAFTNLLLIKRGLPPIFVDVKSKDEYLKALALADMEGKLDCLVKAFCEALIRTGTEFTNFW